MKLIFIHLENILDILQKKYKLEDIRELLVNGMQKEIDRIMKKNEN